MKTHVTKECRCPDCNMVLDRATGSDVPRPNDITICFNCCNVLLFDDDCIVCKPTPEQLDELIADTELWKMIQHTIQGIIEMK